MGTNTVPSTLESLCSLVASHGEFSNNVFRIKKKNDYCKQNMFPARLELATFRVLGGHDNHSLRKLRRRIQAKL